MADSETVNVSRAQFWSVFLCAALAATLAMSENGLRSTRAANLSAQGNPPPPIDAHSITGYVDNQRYFLGTRWRSETFRWIRATEDLGRPPLTGDGGIPPSPKETDALSGRETGIYAHILKLVAQIGNGFWRIPFGLAVEKTALVAPLILQIVLLIGAIWGVGVGSGAGAACVFATLALLAPLITQQFLPGVLESEGSAMGFAMNAVIFFGVGMSGVESRRKTRLACGVFAVVCASVASCLEPAVGLLLVLFIGVARAIGLLLPGHQKLRHFDRYTLISIGFIGAIVGWRFARGHAEWIHASETISQLTALENGPALNLFSWCSANSALSVAAIFLPIAGALGLGIAIWWKTPFTEEARRDRVTFTALLMMECLAISIFRVRWLTISTLLAFLIFAQVAGEYYTVTRPFARFWAQFLFGVVIIVLGAQRLISLRDAHDQSMEWSDVEAMVYRDLAQWLVKHAPVGTVGVLAPPEMTDALVYHGNLRGLITTDRAGRANALTASRILSAVLPDEAESLLQKRGINYVIVPSWDKVLSRLVRVPEEKRKFALLPRLERWAPPRVLKPISYHLPPAAGMENQTIAVYQVVDTQDEGLALSRLAEYFAEMGNEHLAKAAASVLGSSFPDDPNAAIARALVFQKLGDRSAFEHEVPAVVGIAADDDDDLEWDRRVARAIVLALAGRRGDAAKATANCLKTASETRLYSLSPLQVYRLNVLAKNYGLSYPTPQMTSLAAKLSDQIVEQTR